MTLTQEQIAFYHQNGFLQIDDYFNETEISLLCSELPKTIETGSPRIIREENGSVRSVFAPHFANGTYARLARLERLVVPAQQLLESKVYVHQYKVNTKQGLKGDWWEWHQDFPYWHIDDGIQQPMLVSIMVYLQDTDSCNGALLLIPGSHKMGIVKFADKDAVSLAWNNAGSDHPLTKEYLSSLNANIKFTVDHALLKEMSVRNGIVTAAGKRGTALFFHGNVFHASNSNLTPFDRDAILITYNSVNNLPCHMAKPRPDFLAGRDYAPIEDLETII